jgi:hypothetical protein
MTLATDLRLMDGSIFLPMSVNGFRWFPSAFQWTWRSIWGVMVLGRLLWEQFSALPVSLYFFHSFRRLVWDAKCSSIFFDVRMNKDASNELVFLPRVMVVVGLIPQHEESERNVVADEVRHDESGG